MRTETHLAYFLIVLTILISIWPILRTIRFRFWQQKSLEEKKAKPLKPKTPDDCAICREEKACPKEGQIRQLPCPWNEVRNRRWRKKTLSTQGYACNNRKCVYFHIMDESIHALVGYGYHGKNERIQDLMCQACRKKFTVRRDTVLYRLKSHSEKVALALALLAEGIDIERLNLTIRQGVCLLVRRTRDREKYSPELKFHLLWWRRYYHFARYHASLRVKLSQPSERTGNQIPIRYRSRTPATLAPR